MRPLLIGQAPGPRSDPGEPLSGRCGARLAELAGLQPERFLRDFRRVNLIERFPGKSAKGDLFPLDLARKGAVQILLTGAFQSTKVVLLGDNVARAFGFKPGSYPLLRFLPTGATRLGIAFCPHPSGVNRWWNEKKNLRAAAKFWRELARDCG